MSQRFNPLASAGAPAPTRERRFVRRPLFVASEVLDRVCGNASIAQLVQIHFPVPVSPIDRTELWRKRLQRRIAA
jgi:hypothetical protein